MISMQSNYLMIMYGFIIYINFLLIYLFIISCSESLSLWTCDPLSLSVPVGSTCWCVVLLWYQKELTEQALYGVVPRRSAGGAAVRLHQTAALSRMTDMKMACDREKGDGGSASAVRGERRWPEIILRLGLVRQGLAVGLAQDAFVL